MFHWQHEQNHEKNSKQQKQLETKNLSGNQSLEKQRQICVSRNHGLIITLSRPAEETEPEPDSSLNDVQRTHFTSSLQGQLPAARTAEVKLLSAPLQKQIVFLNNRGLVGCFQRHRERASPRWNWIFLIYCPSKSLTFTKFYIYETKSRKNSRRNSAVTWAETQNLKCYYLVLKWEIAVVVCILVY